MAKEDWKLCAEWLVRSHILAGDHLIVAEDAQVFDLAQFLRDGVMLCHLANHLQPGAIDLKDFCLRPQMSQFLCLKNIHAFLHVCTTVFGLKDSDLFDPYDLLDVRDFGKVIGTLASLSHCPQAAMLSIIPFTVSPKHHSPYYNTLPTLASQHGVRDEPLYGIVDVSQELEEDKVYGRLVDFRPSLTKDGLPTSKREMCVKELVCTEKNYIDALNMIRERFMRPLKDILPEQDYHIIFLCIDKLHTIHSGFHGDLLKACTVNRDGAAVVNITIADCFITWKEKLLLYGEFCSNLPRAQELLDRLCETKPLINERVSECQMEANEGRFKLRDLLSVPMQRVLKYHLLLKELIKNTDRSHCDRRSLERALEEMQDLSLYINEVKRDNETLHLINEIESSIFDLLMPDNTTLKDYGRLLKDGELKIKAHSDNRTKTRYIFLFDKVLLMCKARGDMYSYKHALAISQYDVEDAPLREKERNFGFVFVLGEKNKQDALTVGCKTQEIKTKWIEAIRLAQENICPPFANAGNHEFVMASFTEPTICDVCRKLLRGVFYQGYRCQKTNMVVHKECIEKARTMTGPPKPPPKTTPVRLLSVPAERLCKGVARVLVAYQGVPAPTNGQPALILDIDDTVEVLCSDDGFWWEGRLRGREGFFPTECVRLISDVSRFTSTDSLRRLVFNNSSHVSLSSSLSMDHGTLSSSLSADRGTLASLSADHGTLSSSLSADRGTLSSMFSTESQFRRAPLARSMSECLSVVSPRRRIPSIGSGRPIYFNIDMHSSVADCDEYPWFVGGMSREEASRRLERLPNGTYLIRVSQSDMRRGEYALSIKYGRGHPVKHIKLQRAPDGSFFLADCKMFRNIVDLVQYYQQNTLEASFPEVPTVLKLAYKDALTRHTGTALTDDVDVLCYCYALYDYMAMETNQISLRRGDRIAVVSKAGASRGWWKGRLHSKVGYFPSAFVTESEDDDGLFLITSQHHR